MRKTLKSMIVGTPLAPLARRLVAQMGRLRFRSSQQYWERRYADGGNSGEGSYGRLAAFKAEILNGFVARHTIDSVLEFGCGDGNQLSLATYPDYTGVDVAPTAVAACTARFRGDPTKRFVTLAAYDGRKAALTLSLDVVYHLVEDAAFEAHMAALFDGATRFAVIYASNHDEQPVERHVRHRCFTDWVAARRPDFERVEHIPNRYPFDPADPDGTSFADFHIFARV
ncbi:MAG: class I SAM-dependent methyltransferase [Pseudomonadota bacterium]